MFPLPRVLVILVAFPALSHLFSWAFTAQKSAKLHVNKSSTYAKIPSTSFLKWYCKKTKGKKQKYFPCFVHPKPEERLSGTNHPPPKEGEVLIEYLGYHWSDAKTIQFVPETHLKSFYFESDDTTCWAKDPMESHLAAIKKQKALQANPGLNLRTEELVLQFLLDFVRERERETAAVAATENDDDDVSVASSSQNSPMNSPVRKPAPRKQPAAASAVRQVKTLRAGDVIAY